MVRSGSVKLYPAFAGSYRVADAACYGPLLHICKVALGLGENWLNVVGTGIMVLMRDKIRSVGLSSP